MLGSRLARRIVVPVLLLIGALVALLGWVAVRVADAQVNAELERKADRVAFVLDGLPVAPERRSEVVSALERLVNVEIAIDEPGPWPADLYRVLERKAKRTRPAFPDGRPPAASRYFVAEPERDIRARAQDVLRPVIWTGAAGLLVAVVLGLLVARAIARPVRKLADEASLYAAGNQAIEVGQGGPGEIGDLQAAFARMLDAIRTSEQKLRESERFAALGRLAGGIAHELRNPLTAIRMAVETATDHDVQARKIAVGEIERLDRTLREMLDYVRPRKPQRVEVGLADLFEDVRNLLGPQCEHLGVRLEIEPPGAVAVSADRDRLKQALINLVLNAAQAQPGGGGVVRLRSRQGAIEVEDEGPGIPADVRASILQPFVTTKEAGIGLGLAVVKQVADEHDGELDFRTGPDGTTFTLKL